jgi:acyl-CoA synthetase (AMP-forming)/AMP-acid ligase II
VSAAVVTAAGWETMTNQGILSWPMTRAVALRPNNEAIVDGDTRLTYAQWGRRVCGLTAGLRNLGLRSGDVVASIGQNTFRHLECWVGIPAAGMVLNDLNYRLAVAELEFIINDCGARALVADGAYLKVARQLKQRCPALEYLVYAGAESIPDGWISWDDLCAVMPLTEDHADLCAITADTLAAISYTGGTTGLPKGVMQSHGNLLANAKHMLIANPLLPTDRFIHAAPMFHAADAATTFAMTFMGGAHVCIRGFEPELFGKIVEAERVTVALIVPTMINMLLNHPATPSRDLSAWRLLMYGASPMPVELLLKACSMLPCDFVHLYGMTEAAPLVTSTQRTDNREGARGVEPAKSRLASCGQPVVGVEVEVRRPDGSVCRPREVGEVHVRGPNIMQGYWNRPEETAAALLAGGWYKSGDVAWADEDGYLFVVDRAKDMIISGGENIYTTEVENAVFQHPAVLEVAVFGIPNKDFGEMVHAEVVIKAGTSVTSDEIVAVCRKHIGGYKVPRSVAIRSEPLPKSGAGKILKRDLRDPYWKGKERAVN